MSRDLLMDLWQEYYQQLPIKLNVTCTFCRCRQVLYAGGCGCCVDSVFRNPFSFYHEDILTNNIFTCGYCGMQGKVFDSASLFLPPKVAIPRDISLVDSLRHFRSTPSLKELAAARIQNRAGLW